MRISEAAAQCGVSADLIRRLERQGAVTPARRDRNGHRRYSGCDLEELLAAIFPGRHPNGAFAPGAHAQPGDTVPGRTQWSLKSGRAEHGTARAR